MKRGDLDLSCYIRTEAHLNLGLKARIIDSNMLGLAMVLDDVRGSSVRSLLLTEAQTETCARIQARLQNPHVLLLSFLLDQLWRVATCFHVLPIV